jgi:MOSC domain-containing protein YiiM
LILNTFKQWTKPDRRDLTLGEYIKILTRVAEYLTCDGTELTMVDQGQLCTVEDVVVIEGVLPRVPCWRRLERDGKIVREQQPLPQ